MQRYPPSLHSSKGPPPPHPLAGSVGGSSLLIAAGMWAPIDCDHHNKMAKNCLQRNHLQQMCSRCCRPCSRYHLKNYYLANSKRKSSLASSSTNVERHTSDTNIKSPNITHNGKHQPPLKLEPSYNSNRPISSISQSSSPFHDQS